MSQKKAAQFQIKDIPDMTGHVAIVTGGNSGIGYQTSLQLAIKGAKVYIASRSVERIEDAIGRMRESTPKSVSLDLQSLEMDLQSLQSVKDAAEDFMKRESQLHLLINNAGVMAVPYKLTTDGFETHWQTNQLAPHLLFTTLLPILRSTASTSASKDIVRVVNVSSDAAFLNSPKELNYQDPNLTSTTGAMAAWKRYGHSKLASIIHARAIHNRYREREGISAYSLNPGVAKTNLQAADPTSVGTAIRLLVRFAPFVVSPLDACRTTLFCATSVDDAPSKSGCFFVPFGKLDDRADRWINDERTVDKLWDECERMVEKFR